MKSLQDSQNYQKLYDFSLFKEEVASREINKR